MWVDGIYRQSGQVCSHVCKRAAKTNRIAVENGTLAKADANPLNPLNPLAAVRLTEISILTMVLAGALDHPEVLRAVDLLANEIRGAKKVILPDSVHIPNMEKPANLTGLCLIS